MNKKIKISKLEFTLLLTFPILTTFNYISFNKILNISQTDTYLSVIYAFIIGLIPLYLFIYIFNYKPNLSLSEKNIYLFGNLLGTIINYITIFIVSIIGIIILYSTSNFIIIHYLKETSKIIVILIIGIITIFNVKQGIEVITRTSFIFFIIIIIVTIFSVIGLITKFNINNILPILNNNFNNVIKSGNILALNSILPIYMLLIVPKNYIKNPKNINRYIFIFYFLNFLLIFLICLLSIGILGINLINIYPHPEYIILKKISVFNFIDRIENIVYLKWILNNFITMTLIIYFISNSIKKEDKTSIIPLTITSILIMLPIIIFKDNIEFNIFITKSYNYSNTIFLGIITLTTLNIFIKKRKKRLK